LTVPKGTNNKSRPAALQGGFLVPSVSPYGLNPSKLLRSRQERPGAFSFALSAYPDQDEKASAAMEGI
jgi:hypothetical protein